MQIPTKTGSEVPLEYCNYHNKKNMDIFGDRFHPLKKCMGYETREEFNSKQTIANS